MDDLAIPEFLKRNQQEPSMTQHEKQPPKTATNRLSGTARIRREIENEIASIDKTLQTLTDMQARKAALQNALSELPD